MKKLPLAVLALSLLVSCARSSWMPHWFEQEHTVEYREVPTRRYTDTITSVTKEQALADLDFFKYLIETSYAGYEYQQEKLGVNFEKNFDHAQAYIQKLDSETLSYNEFKEIISIALSGVQDGHFSFMLPGLGPYQHKTFYYSGITVSRKNGKYLVEASSVDGVSPGDRYRGPKEHLFRTYSDDGNRYRIGTLSRTPVNTLSLKFKKEMVEVPVAPDMILPGPEVPVYSLTDDVAYLRIPSFIALGESGTVSPEGRKQLEEVIRHIRMLDKGNTVIIDLRNNPGGYTDTSALVPAILFKRQASNFMPEMAELFSPGTTQARLQNIWDKGDNSDGYRNLRKAAQLEADKQKKNPVRRWERQSYRVAASKPIENKRKVIIIINRCSASASEILCAIRTIPNVTIIGENSAGILSFGAGQLYVLPNSQVPVLVPDRISFNTSFSAGEGTGVLPDYWVLNDNLEDVLRSMTGNDSFTIPAESSPR